MEISHVLPEYVKAIDIGEPDPLGDAEFFGRELAYVASMSKELTDAVERIYDSTGRILMGMRYNYNKDAFFDLVMKEVRKEIGVNVPFNLRNVVKDSVEGIYAYSRKAITKASFKVVDLESIEYLKASDNFYVGKQFGRYSDKVREVLRETIFEKGFGANQVAKEIRNAVGDQVNLKFHQYENVARTSANRVRNWSRAFAFEEAKVKRVEFIAMMDERTSEICQAMNGMVWETKEVTKRLVEVMEAGEDRLPEVSPFPALKDKYDGSGNLVRLGVQNISGVLKSSTDLVKMGVVAPPLHGRCRSVLVESIDK